MPREINFFLLIVLLLMVIFPILSIGIECVILSRALHLVLVGKWFLFWAVGVRLFTAGIKQSINPAFTAEKIFHITDKSGYPVVRELGFANICMGLLGTVSLILPQFRIAAACAGGLYFGLAGFLHILKKRDSFNESVAMVSDVGVFVVMAVYVFVSFLPGCFY